MSLPSHTYLRPLLPQPSITSFRFLRGRGAVSRCAAFALQLSEIPELMQEKGRRNVEKNNGWIETRGARHLPPWLPRLLRQTETPLKGLGPIHLSPIHT